MDREATPSLQVSITEAENLGGQGGLEPPPPHFLIRGATKSGVYTQITNSGIKKHTVR